ncbi:ABC transporter ATP-binding protein [Pullulanibacillus camelliae]|uniref:ABC transporter ATP-binding protein n=1 Tax=Pullulanibacillus camelliae TaxID=1707096 RepID=A0A8J2VK23_9BACL|nr:ABC transporter ATP-binding protein [Pullulanibacillus camelliae]GGE28311.1 ABC transporter ATP-binding protein [Pullulanibacillus camelliae]
MFEHILEVKDLGIQFKTAEGFLSAVHGISFNVKRGETVCIVGESGCGKSVSALSLIGLLPNNGEVYKGAIKFQGKDLTKLTSDEIRKLRGNDISMIFQEPMTALNPVFTIGYQLREPLKIHQGLNKARANQVAIDLLRQVGISVPEQRMKQYPHELSGGMRQRVMIAIALACNPKILIADEPTTALDVTIQAQILELLNDLKQRFETSVVMITHDMGVVAEVADRVIVMYSGEIVEQGDVETIFNHPEHPYTQGLLASVPNVDLEQDILEAIPGTMPNLEEQISGCRFHPRCPFATDKCRETKPDIFSIDQHDVRCWLKEAEADGQASRIISN